MHKQTHAQIASSNKESRRIENGISYIFLFATITLFALDTMGQTSTLKVFWPSDVESNLIKAGNNRPELEKTLVYFKKNGDSLSLKAACFLIANMDIHYTETCYWVDSLGDKVEFNELSYPNPRLADLALDKKKSARKIHAIGKMEKDLEHMSSKYLINHIHFAIKAWKGGPASKLAFKDFCEYILPYRVTVEPLEDWADVYQKCYKGIRDSLARGQPIKKVIAAFGEDRFSDFRLTSGLEVWREMLPRLGGLQLQFRKSGECGDVATLEAMALRAQGIPVSYNSIVFWATSTGSHYLSTAFDVNMQPMPLYGPTEKRVGMYLSREPAKVIRTTYSKQPGTLASLLGVNEIPTGFMQTLNYVDVTGQYWPVRDLKCKLWGPLNSSVIYAAIFSGGAWQPAWWARPSSGSAFFTQMPKGVIVLPMHYRRGGLEPAGYPAVNDSQDGQVLEPDKHARITLHIKQEARYLIFRPGKSYTLYYWDKTWIKADAQTAGADTQELVFKEVPSNALYILIPEYSEGRERPFVISLEGERKWY